MVGELSILDGMMGMIEYRVKKRLCGGTTGLAQKSKNYTQVTEKASAKEKVWRAENEK